VINNWYCGEGIDTGGPRGALRLQAKVRSWVRWSIASHTIEIIKVVFMNNSTHFSSVILRFVGVYGVGCVFDEMFCGKSSCICGQEKKEICGGRRLYTHDFTEWGIHRVPTKGDVENFPAGCNNVTLLRTLCNSPQHLQRDTNRQR